VRQATWEDMWRAVEPAPPPERKAHWITKLALLSWEEWVTLVIVFLGFISVVQSLDHAEWAPEMPSLYPTALVGLAISLFLAKTPLPEFAAHLVGLVAGAGVVVVASTASLSGSLSDRVSELVDRMQLWFSALSSGGISNDNLPFVFIVVGLTFVTAYISVWSIFRWYNAWVGLIPGGLALLTNLSYLPGHNSFNLLVYLFCAILLVSRIHLLRNEREWRRTRTAYPDLISLHVLNVTIWVAFLLLAFAWILPVGSGTGLLFQAWDKVTAPIAGPFQDFGRLFTSVDSKKGGLIHKFGSTLPLQGKITLSSGNELTVEATEPGFLRAQSYDFYTAQGWKISSAEQITNSVWPALKPLQNPDEAKKEFRRPLSIRVTTFDKQSVILSASQPLAASIDTRVVFGPDPSDVTSLRPNGRLGSGTQYQIDSTITTASPPRLRQSGPPYPGWVAPYLQLPDSLPQAIRTKTKEITAGLDTPYDQANAIEKYLRTFAVDTNFTPAPANKDGVAYFLFTAQKGYFDYHASAMVVMLRTLGIPARIAVGYTIRPQDRAPDSNTYTVTEGNAFAWPEVYFPGLGWIEFNPTPSEPSISRPDSDDTNFFPDDSAVEPDDTIGPSDQGPDTGPADATLNQLADEGGRSLIVTLLMATAALFLTGGVLGYAVFRFTWERGIGGLDYPSQIWEKTLRLARWAQIPVAPQQTPSEYTARLHRELPDVEDVDFLGATYVRTRFGHKALDPKDRDRLTAVWQDLRANLLARILHWR
jgi:transglutaminase-like putative cysteine protease